MLFAVDLDGTLFGRDSQVSARTVDSLDQASKAGHFIVAVTGRSFRTCVERLVSVAAIEYIVCSNGAYIYDVAAAKIIQRNPMDAVACLAAMRKIRAQYPNVGFGWESGTGFSYEKAFLKQSDQPASLEHGGSGGVLGQSDLYKLLIRLPDIPVEAFAVAINELVGDVLEASTSGAPFLDGTALNSNKAIGLMYVAQLYKVESHDVVAFGDNLNDLPMLNWAGTAVAMGNAHPTVISVADALTVSNVRDGVAVYMDRLLQD